MAVAALRERFGQAGCTIPETVRVSTGFPKGFHGHAKAIGQCSRTRAALTPITKSLFCAGRLTAGPPRCFVRRHYHECPTTGSAVDLAPSISPPPNERTRASGELPRLEKKSSVATTNPRPATRAPSARLPSRCPLSSWSAPHLATARPQNPNAGARSATASAGRRFCRPQHPRQMPWSFFLRLSSIFLIASSAEWLFWTFSTSWAVGCR